MLNKSNYSIGFWCQFIDHFSIRNICNLNYDWIALDMEHGVYNYKDIAYLSNLIKSYKKITMVRLKLSTEIEVQRCLDNGADGLILPMIDDPLKLQKLILKTMYPPKGSRSVGYSSSNNFGLDLNRDIKSKFKPFIVIQIENKKGIENLEKLININGVDAIMVGPYDLSASLGCPGQFKNKKFLDCLEIVNKTLSNSKVYKGYHIVKPDEKELKSKIKSGYKFIAYGTDGTFINSKFSLPNTV